MIDQSPTVHWWEKGDRRSRRRELGDLVPEAGPCPLDGARIVYNGNYFCENWGACNWALAHPARSRADREICTRLGITYV